MPLGGATVVVEEYVNGRKRTADTQTDTSYQQTQLRCNQYTRLWTI